MRSSSSLVFLNKRAQQRQPAACSGSAQALNTQRRLASTQASKRTQQGNPAAAPAPKLPTAHSSGALQQRQPPKRTQPRRQRPSPQCAHSSGTRQRRQRPPKRAQRRHQHPCAHSSGALQRYSTQAQKRTHAAQPILEVRTPLALAIWTKTI